MSLPPLAPIPPANIRLSFAPEEWSACLEAWLALAEHTLRISAKDLAGSKASHSGVNDYLGSFYHELSHAATSDQSLRNPKAQQLQKTSFRLVHRVLTGERDKDALLLECDFLADFCHVHVKSSALVRLMAQLWKTQGSVLQAVMQPKKASLISSLEYTVQGTGADLQRLAPIMRASPDMAAFFMTGSDFLDSLNGFYGRTVAVEDRKAAILILYLGLESLVKVEPQNLSLLSDHLYSLKASADKPGSVDSALADLITNTPLTGRLRRSVSGKGSERLFKLLDTLETYRSTSIARPRRHVRQKADKGKARASGMEGEVHMHRMSLITQVQDLFPDLGSGFIMKLLDEYEDSVEQVTAHLLDDSLPPHLRDLDRTEQAPTYITNQASAVDHLAPRSTPPPQPEPFIPERRNVFDDDELDHLQLDTARLHIGKRNTLTSSSNTQNKSAILSALAAFDSDDDERDDTYDVDDVGGTVDTAHPDGEPAPQNSNTNNMQAKQAENDATLFYLFKSSPQLFGRTFDIRRGQARQALKAETRMTDEAIEGWAIMLQRDPKRLARLESRYNAPGSGFDGRQKELGRTAYRESGTETEDSDAGGVVDTPRGGFRGRDRGSGRAGGVGGEGGGRGRGGRGRGGSVAGPSNDAGTAAAQRRKEESKGSRANHNRRDQRARKMGRGGFAG